MEENIVQDREGEPTFDIDDWINELMPDGVESARNNDGMEETNSNLPSANADELANNAANMNEGSCGIGATKSDMIPGIHQDLKSMDSSSEDCNNILRRDMAPSTLHRIRSSQLAVPELQRIQKVQQPIIRPSLIHSNSLHGYQNQQKSMQFLQLQSHKQPTSTSLHETWKRQQLYNPSLLQSKLQTGTANHVLDKLQSSALQHKAPSIQQPQEVQNKAFGLVQQQMSSSCTDSRKTERHQQPLDILGCSDFIASQQNFHQVSQPVQFHQQRSTGSLTDILPHGMQKRIQTPSSHPQSMVIGNELKSVELSQNMPHEALSESITQNEQPNQTEWHDQAYQQLQSMKEIYLSELIKMLRMTHELSHKPPNAESAYKYEKTRVFLEKSIKLLHISRGDIGHCSKEKVYNQMELIKRYIYQIRVKNAVPGQHRQPLPQLFGSPSKTTAVPQKENTLFQFGLSNAGSAPTAISTSQLAARQRAVNLQASPRHKLHDSSLPALGNVDGSEIDPLPRNLVRFTHQNALRGPQQSNMIISPKRSSQTGLEQIHETLSTPQRARSSARNLLSTLDSTTRSVPRNSTAVQFQNMKHREDHQNMQAQEMKKPLHLPQIDQNKKSMMLLRMNEKNDLRFGQAVNFSPRTREQHHQLAQHTDHTSQTLLSSSSYHHHAASPQNPQSSVQQVDLKDLSSKQSIAATPLQSSGSPYIVPSSLTPLTPLTPSSMQVDQEKNISGFSPPTLSESVTHSKVPVSPLQNKSQSLDCKNLLGTDIVGAMDSHLPIDCAEQADSQQRDAEGDPLTRLIEAVKLSSTEALSASVHDIGTVINSTDSVAESLLYQELRDVSCEDLVVDSSHWEKDNLTIEHGNTSEKRMKRKFNSVPLETLPSACGSDNLKKLNEQKSDSESTSIYHFKRLKTKTNNLLLQEIKEINKHLLETAVNVIIDSTDFSGYGADEGTLVECSYVALGQFASSRSEFPNLLVRFLVTNDYPNSSPQVLDVSPHRSSENEGVKAMSQKAMSKFSLSLRKFSYPMSLSEMAKAWDVCAREVLREYAKDLGGDCFSSRYGTWENCVAAA